MPFATRDAVRIYYRIDGRGDAPPLLLVGSLGSDHGIWTPVMTALSQAFRVIRIDQRGHGGSDAPSGDYSIEMLGRDVLAVADALAIEQFSYAGVSIGAMIGIWLGAHAPQRISRLVLANTTAQAEAARYDERITQVLLGGMSSVAEAVLGRFFTPAYAARRTEHYETVKQTLLSLDPIGYAGCCAAIRDMNLLPLLPRITAPTLVISGSFDQATPAEMGRKIATAVVGASYVELGGAHLSHSERPAQFADLLVRFVRGEVVAPGREQPAARHRNETDRFALGLGRRKEILGRSYVEDRIAKADPFTARFQDLITRYAWGEIWTSPIFDDRQRRLLVLAMCIAMGRWEEFRLHVAKGLAAELEPVDVEELMMQAAIYCGVPAANTAFHHAQELLHAGDGTQ